MSEKPERTPEDRSTAVALSAIGTVVLVLACGYTAVLGMLSPMVTGGSAAEGPVASMLLIGALVVLVGGCLLTWRPDRPRAWVPCAGILTLIVLWIVGNVLTGGRLL